MDNQTNNIINQPLINPNPTPAEIKSSPLARIINWVNTHRKQVYVVLASAFLVIVAVFTLFPAIKDKFLNNLKQNIPGNILPKPESPGLGSITINTPKTGFALAEKIPVSIKSQTGGIPVTAFDVVIEYDPEFLTISERKTPPLQDFLYYGKNTNELISVSAIQKPTSQTAQVFKDTTLFELEFTPKKKGKTTLKIVYMPNSTNDSNLLDSANKDILSNARGMEITIN
jgi:hypothetical protein